MIASSLFLAAVGLLFFALVEMAFTLLMRLPQRLEAERESEDDALAAYLEDPLKFFVPARLMRGALLILFVVLLAQHVDTGWVGAASCCSAAAWRSPSASGRSCRRSSCGVSPERVLDAPAAALHGRRERHQPAHGAHHRVPRRGRAPRRRAGAPADQPAARAVRKPRRRSRSAPTRSRLLRSVVDFGETLVREVMTPRPDIVAIRADATIDDLRQLVQEQEYSRLPVYTENLDNIVGLVVVKDLIQRTDVLAGSRSVSEIMRPAAFVPETKRVLDLLREFQQSRFQLAIVVDEYGGTAGLVTVEDVVEELVGEIRDEYDSEAEPIVREADDTFVFSAKVGDRRHDRAAAASRSRTAGSRPSAATC